jgi:hypothetical protein
LKKDDIFNAAEKGMIWLSISSMMEYIDPFNAWMELESPIEIHEVLYCLENNNESLAETPLLLSSSGLTPEKLIKLRQNHIRKIAYFVKNGFSKPIDIEWEEQKYNSPIQDGNHRIVAAIIKKDTHINAYVSGFMDIAYDDGLFRLCRFENFRL